MSDDTRTNNYKAARRIPSTYIKNPEQETFRPRYSKVFQPGGLKFFRAFNVVYKHYWRMFQLITLGDVDLYNLLTYLAEEDEQFTMRGLEALTGTSHNTLGESLDRLENAELIHRLSYNDGQPGRPMQYIVLRTPLFASPADLTPKAADRLRKEGGRLPETFLVDEEVRLRRAIDENHARARRRDPSLRPATLHNLEAEMRRELRNSAGVVSFNDILDDMGAELARQDNLQWDVIFKWLALEMEKAGLGKLTPKLKELAQRHFEQIHAAQQTAHAAEAAAAADEVSGSDLDYWEWRYSSAADGAGLARLEAELRAQYSEAQARYIAKYLESRQE